MKKLLIMALLAISFAACEKENASDELKAEEAIEQELPSCSFEYSLIDSVVYITNTSENYDYGVFVVTDNELCSTVDFREEIIIRQEWLIADKYVIRLIVSNSAGISTHSCYLDIDLTSK